MSFPLLVRPIRLSIEAVDQRLEQAAGNAGATPWRVFLSVTLPLALPGVLGGMVLGFAKAIGEFGATITFVSNIPGETQTISSAIFSLIQTPNGDTAALRLVLGFDRNRDGRADCFRSGSRNAPPNACMGIDHAEGRTSQNSSANFRLRLPLPAKAA